MNIIQEIAAALAIIALGLIVNYTIKNWQAMTEDLGFFFKQKDSKTKSH
jgi:ABC-type Fe2+-enterobactin transport system substrate-binding protein